MQAVVVIATIIAGIREAMVPTVVLEELGGCFQSRDVSENNNNNMSSISMRVSEKPLALSR